MLQLILNWYSTIGQKVISKVISTSAEERNELYI